MISSSTGILRKKLFWTNEKFAFFFNWEKFVEQIDENIWWIRYKSIIQLQGENGIDRLDLGLKEKDSDIVELLWSLNAIYSREIWEEGRVHLKSKSTEKTYEYAVWIMKSFLYTISFEVELWKFLYLEHNICFIKVHKNLRKILGVENYTVFR